MAPGRPSPSKFTICWRNNCRATNKMRIRIASSEDVPKNSCPWWCQGSSAVAHPHCCQTPMFWPSLPARFSGVLIRRDLDAFRSTRPKALQSPLHKNTHELLIFHAPLLGLGLDLGKLAFRDPHGHAGGLVLELMRDGLRLSPIVFGQVCVGYELVHLVMGFELWPWLV